MNCHIVTRTIPLIVRNVAQSEKKDDVTYNTIRGGVSQQTDDAFWNAPDTLAALDEVMNAIEQRDCFKRMHNEGPSYSLGLGLTPDYVVAADDVDDGARQRTSVDRDKNIAGTSLTVDSQRDKGKRKIDDTDIIVKHSVDEASDVDVESDDDEVFPSVSTRTSAGTFVKAISGLSNVKKNAVREMGFGRLLELSITTTPLKMGFWLVNNFNHLDRKLQLYDGEKVHVKKEDVYAVFGLPRGELEVNNKKKRVTSNMLDEWIALFDVRRPSNITVSKVLDKINECDDGGVWFKRHFIVLMLFYVDKEVLSVRSVPRRFPTFSSWSNEALRNRECDEIASMPSGEVSWMQTLSIPTSMIKCVRTLTTS
ncbi:Unknown protein [Striga hermonthica]|uniref:Uncharacterized protein n=1 Tax=Striga hermonthica TaxID=68872 RepID=A0A9N7QZZ6_STRHE|nr:Unknown protein [Striga hermonthica]